MDLSTMEIKLSNECEPLATINDCVNIITGGFYQVENDLFVDSIEPIHYTRFYDSDVTLSTASGITINHSFNFPWTASAPQHHKKHNYALISEREGFKLTFKGEGDGNYQLDERTLKKGYTNTSRAGLSGQKNLHNAHAEYNGKWKVFLGDGTKRIYSREIGKIDNNKTYQIQNIFLTEEIRPNGSKLKINYIDKAKWTSIASYTRAGVKISELTRHSHEDHHTIRSNRGDFVNYYTYGDKKSRSLFLGKIESSKGPTTLWHYELFKHDHPKLSHIEKPEGRFLKIHYDKKRKVSSLYDPRGRLYRFSYHDQYTSVYNALDQHSIYRYSDENRITHIQDFDDNAIAKQQHFVWDKKGNLKEKYLSGSDSKNHFHCTEYKYDKRGNIIQETLYGNLTGQKEDTFSDNKATDSYTISYLYSDDGFNLMLRKTTPELEVHYSYLKKTNLLKSQFTFYNGISQERIFHFYDDHGVIIKTIEDDGSSPDSNSLDGVTTRKITTIQPLYDANHPAFGKPATIKESYFDVVLNQELPLKKREYQYNAKGLPIAELVFDAEGVYRYTLSTEYDSRDRVVAKSNALNQFTKYAYDDNNNLIKEEFEGKVIFYRYDACNRLVAQEERYPEGDSFTFTFTYDPLDRIIASTDRYGNTTSQSYDRFGNEIKRSMPPIADANGQLHSPTIEKQYNPLGQLIKETDANGHITQIRNNVYGKPIEIKHPDGSIERFLYYTNGELKQHWSADGVSVLYTRDPKGRITREQTLDAQGNILKQLEWEYKGHRLMSKKDAMGTVSRYHFDGACRLSVENIAGHHTSYTYDTLGRLHETIKQIGDEQQIESLKYDNLDRITEKTIRDHNGTLFSKEEYAYDAFGKLTETRIYPVDDLPSVYKTKYHSVGWPLKKTDPLGHITTIESNHSFFTPQGLRVLQTTTTDPMGRRLIETYDTLGQLSRSEIHAPDLLSYTDYYYDMQGNKTEERHHEVKEGSITKTYSISWQYDWQGNISTLQEGNKKTQFIYDSLGRLVRKIKPDGTTLDYYYDALDRLIQLKAPGISYRFIYDLNNNCLQTIDEIHQLEQHRRYNILNCLVYEEITPGNAIAMGRDSLGRITSLALPDGSTTHYQYDILNLKAIQRGLAKFTMSYDLCGHQTERKLPNNLKINTRYDPLGRPIRIEAPSWIQTLDSFDANGNLLQSTLNDRVSKYSYDGLNQLIAENETHFSYDAFYNRLEVNNIRHEYNDNNQIDLPHDGNGNLVSNNYKYDALDRLVQLDDLTLIYDPFNRLIQIKSKDSTSNLLYMDYSEIGSSTNGVVEEYKLIDPTTGATYAIEQKDASKYTVQDHQGNIASLISEDFTIQNLSYTAFSPVGESTIPWRFSAKREIGSLVYFGKRFYSPILGRWLTPDPIYFEDGLNLYAYVKNNPLRYHDPNGLFALPNFISNLNPLRKGLPKVSYFDSYETLQPWYPQSKGLTLGKPDVSNVGIIFVNGINNSEQDTYKNMEYISQLSGGYNVEAVYNATHHVSMDLVECALNLCYIATPPVRELHKKWDEFFDRSSDDAICFTICHSHGEIIGRDAGLCYDVNRRERIIICGIAPGAYAYKETFRSVKHFRVSGFRDPIPRIDIFGSRRVKDTIVTLPSHPQAKLHDHDFRSPSYRRVLNREINDYIKASRK